MTIRIAAVGFAHNHIFNLVGTLLDAEAELVWYYDEDAARSAQFVQRFPQAQRAETLEQILEDETIHLVVSAAVPNERASLGIRAMQHDKDYLCAKPGFTSLEQLADVRRVQRQTGRIYSVYFGERLHNPATVKAGELVHAGAIGQVIQTVGFGPHRLLGHVSRPEWAFDRRVFGGVINDLASHQIDQFLFFTGSTSADIVSAHIGNFKHTQFPLMHDFGDITLRSPSATGYIRVDWLTPRGLDTWGDVRLFILGTDGYIELRKNTDIAGREGSNHLFIVDHDSARYIDCQAVPMPFASQLIQDVCNRTETAMLQDHAFLASELALKAELMAVELT